MTICLLGYAQLIFRFSDLTSLRECDIDNEHVEILSNLTAWVPIVCTNSNICPVAMLVCFPFFFRPANIQGDVDKLLFKGLILTE